MAVSVVVTVAVSVTVADEAAAVVDSAEVVAVDSAEVVVEAVAVDSVGCHDGNCHMSIVLTLLFLFSF